MTIRKANDMTNVYSYARWSTPTQSDGDSDRRQSDAAQRWCTSKGLKLSDRSFKDKGISAKAGKNRAKGSEFAALLEYVKPGDYILIEDSDRFSREDPITALHELRETLRTKAVTIVFLVDGTEVNKDNVDDYNIVMRNFFKASGAHYENKEKARKIRESWKERKRLVIEEGKMINQGLPCWLKWSRDTKSVTLMEGKAAVVRRIFKLYLEGNGILSIARILNESGTLKISRTGSKRKASSQWSTGTIYRFLTTKQVIGCYTAAEPPVPGIFPAIVDEKSFFAVARQIKQLKTAPRRFVDNSILQGLIVCSKCGHALVRHTQTSHGKTYSYLLCGGSNRGVSNCGFEAIRYPILEKSFLSVLAHGNMICEQLPCEQDASRIDELNARMAETEKQIAKLRRLILGDDSPAQTLVDALKDFETQKKEIAGQIEVEQTKSSGALAPLKAYKTLSDLSGRVSRVADFESDPDFRTQARSLLPQFVERIAVHLGKDQYQVFFKGWALPIQVTIGPKETWIVDPAPAAWKTLRGKVIALPKANQPAKLAATA